MDQDSASAERIIRVFVSSTFQDMHAEREELVKRAFPALRQLCSQRGVVWGEVDLRWGVTDEQKAEGKVLPICLEEIRRCRPYFIGILGERYGWIPNEIPDQLIEREPWLREHKNRSVTELEILHGVLRNTEMSEHAFFYFRDPAYLESLPPDQRDTFRSQDAESVEKLQALKERIRKSGFPVRETYPNPKTLGLLILADLTAVINQLFPEERQPDSVEREAAGHEAFARSRAGVYIGRATYFQSLDDHAAGDGPPLVVLGESGSGKSALLANWALQNHRKSHPHDLLLMHFIGATPASADWAAMVRRLLGEFNRRFDLKIEVPDKPDALRMVFTNALYMAATKGRVVLILDALNQLEDRDQAPDLVWLPPVLPPSVRIILSTLPGRALDELGKRRWPTLNIEPLELTERQELIVEYLKQYTKQLSPERVERIARAPQSANPLYLRALLEELRVWGDHESLDRRIEHYLGASTPEALYQRILTRYEQDYERDRRGLVRDALSLLWAARRGLSEVELMDLLGTGGQPLPRAYWSALYLAAEQSLVSRTGLLGFSHDYLRQAVKDKYLADGAGQQEAHMRLVEYFGGRELDARKVDELPWQLAAAQSWQRLAALLAEPSFFGSAWDRNQFEVKGYWSQIEVNSQLRMVEECRSVIDGSETDVLHTWRMSLLLADGGHPGEAFALRSRLALHFEESGDQRNLALSYGSQANILQAWGQLEEALALLKKQEAICLELGEKDGLARSYGDRALILRGRGQLEEALALLTKAAAIHLDMGNRYGLQASYGGQALVLYAWGRLEEALALLKKKETICLELGDKVGLAVGYCDQGMILKAWGRLEEALALLRKQEAICLELGDKDGLARSYGNQAVILQVWGRLEEALGLLKKQEVICLDVGSKQGLGASYGNQAVILQVWGRLEEALTLLKNQETVWLELDDQYGLQANYGNQAVILKAWGHLQEALVLHKKEEAICLKLGNEEGLSRSYGNQALILKAGGGLHEALALHKMEEAICLEQANKDGLARSYGNQALILYAWGRLEEAMALLKNAEAIFFELGNKYGLQGSYGNQAVILKAWGRLEEALALHQKEEAVCLELGNKDGLQRSYCNQALILQGWGRLEEALALLKKAEATCLELGNKDGLQASYGNQAVVQKNWGRLEEALALLKKQETICRELGNVQALAISLANQALAINSLNDRRQALRLATEAYEVAIQSGYPPLATHIEEMRASIAGATSDSAPSQYRPSSFRHQPAEVQASVPSARSVAESERKIQDNLQRQRRLAEYAHQLAEWKKLGLWKRMSTPRPVAPD